MLGMESGSRCPGCSTVISREKIDLSSPFRCLSCDQSLRVTRLWTMRIALASLVLAGLVSYGFCGPESPWRGPSFSFTVLLTMIPILGLLTRLAFKFDPPRLVLSDDYSLRLSRTNRHNRK